MSNQWYDYYQFVRVGCRSQGFIGGTDIASCEMMSYDNGPSNAVNDAIDYSKHHPDEYIYLYEWTLCRGLKLAALFRDGKPDIGLCVISSPVHPGALKAIMPLISTYLQTMVRASEGDAAEVKGDAIP